MKKPMMVTWDETYKRWMKDDEKMVFGPIKEAGFLQRNASQTHRTTHGRSMGGSEGPMGPRAGHVVLSTTLS